MDAIGVFIARLHGLIGHDKAAAFIGQPPGNKGACVLCAYEKHPTEDRRQTVIRALSPGDAG